MEHDNIAVHTKPQTSLSLCILNDCSIIRTDGGIVMLCNAISPPGFSINNTAYETIRVVIQIIIIELMFKFGIYSAGKLDGQYNMIQ